MKKFRFFLGKSWEKTFVRKKGEQLRNKVGGKSWGKKLWKKVGEKKLGKRCNKKRKEAINSKMKQGK